MTPYSIEPRAPRRHTRGYILVEALVAMTLLSAGMIAIHGGVRQTLFIRGQARDYTQARFLLENVIAELDLQPEHVMGSKSGSFGGEYSRFGWKWTISRIDLPTPPIPPDVPPEDIKKLNKSYLAKVRATVTWTRSGHRFEETAETLLAPERLFIPQEERERPPAWVY